MSSPSNQPRENGFPSLTVDPPDNNWVDDGLIGKGKVEKPLADVSHLLYINFSSLSIAVLQRLANNFAFGWPIDWMEDMLGPPNLEQLHSYGHLLCSSRLFLCSSSNSSSMAHAHATTSTGSIPGAIRI